MIEFYGAKKEVGRSMIKINDVFLDAGVKLSDPIELPDYDKEIDDVIITHAHLDHCGYLPHIAYKIKRIHASKPTRDLIQLLLSDYQRIQKEKKFTTKEVYDVMQKIQIHEFNESFMIGKNKITLYDAGHILGSCMVKIETAGKSYLYTGDLSVRETKILTGAETNIGADELVIETTYSGDEDSIPSIKNASKELLEIVKKTIEKKGHVIIPTFAVGRGQNILLVLADYIRSGALPNIPIYVDGMIKKANKIYRHNVIYAKRELQMRILTSMDDPFINPVFKIPRKKDKTDVLETPSIIVTTSGMISGGPVLTYLKHLVGDDKSTLCLVGYQVEGTRGRMLLDGGKKINIDNVDYDVKINVSQVHFSAHADRNDLLRFIETLNKNKTIKKIYLVHGEEQKMQQFKKKLEKKFDAEVVIP
ncbi:MBL fold metallo-hydrolase [Candidatus Micrarchaeota archaeon]|nr:MBL fold metallo-hydrolase [Candidatus Micrarchaeota archaeon]